MLTSFVQQNNRHTIVFRSAQVPQESRVQNNYDLGRTQTLSKIVSSGDPKPTQNRVSNPIHVLLQLKLN